MKGLLLGHATLHHIVDMGIVTAQAVIDMDVEVCIRHPFTRFFSGYQHRFNRKMHPSMVRESVYKGSFVGVRIFDTPQKAWTHHNGVQVADLMLFEDYTNEAMGMMARLGDNSATVPMQNVRAEISPGFICDPYSHLNPPTRSILTEKYYDDVQMWHQLADAKNYTGTRWE